MVGRFDPILGLYLDKLGRLECATNGNATYESEDCWNQCTRAKGGKVSPRFSILSLLRIETDSSSCVPQRYELGIDTIDAVSIDPGRSAESLGHLPPQKDADGNPL